MNTLIIISGHSCTGKSKLGNYLADKLNYILFGKDFFKEALFDSLGWEDKNLSKQFSATSLSLLYSVLEEVLKRKQSIIIEANFKPEIDRGKIKILVTKYKPKVIELHCFADPTVLLNRFIRRFKLGERHGGHLDNEHTETAKQNFFNSDLHSSLNLGKVIEIDTTDFDTVNYAKIAAEIIN